MNGDGLRPADDMQAMILARRNELVRLTEAAVAVALCVLLGNIRLVELPNGGSIALAALPLLALAVVRGARLGMLAGCCAGAAHALSGGTIIHPVQLGLDYFVAYGALGLAGMRPTGALTRQRLVPGIVLAMSAQLAAMMISGMVFFAPVAGDAALAYSFLYNASTVLPELALAIWMVPPLARALARANLADSWRRGLLEPPRSHARTPREIHAPATIDTRLTPDVSIPVSVAAPITRAAPFTAQPLFRSLRLTPREAVS